GVLARALEHVRPLGGEFAEVDLGGLVGAVLAPQGGGDAELGPVGIAAEDLPQPLEFVLGQTDRAGGLGIDRGLLENGHRLAPSTWLPASTALASRVSPSVLPRIGSEQRS